MSFVLNFIASLKKWINKENPSQETHLTDSNIAFVFYKCAI